MRTDQKKILEKLKSLRGKELEAYVLTVPWYARPNVQIGGWCVMPIDSPNIEVFEVADFISEKVAKHIADLHNKSLRE